MRQVRILVLFGLAGMLVLPSVGMPQFSFQPQGGGGPQGGGMGRGGGRGFGDPAQIWEMIAKGKDSINRNDLDPGGQFMFDRMAQRMGVTSGVITKQQYLADAQQRAQGLGGGRGGPGGNPMMAPQVGGMPTFPGMQGMGGGPDMRMGPGMDQINSRAERDFRRLDRNGDGLINNDEMPEALRIERDKYDADRNGLIDLNEYKAYFQGLVQQMQAERNAAGGGGPPGMSSGLPPLPSENPPEEEEKKPTVHRAGQLPKDIPPWFSQADTNGDAQVGLYEWKNTGRPLDEFSKYDRNRDGFITVDEAMFFVAQSNPPPSNQADNGKSRFPGMGNGGYGSTMTGSPAMGMPFGGGGMTMMPGFGGPGRDWQSRGSGMPGMGEMGRGRQSLGGDDQMWPGRGTPGMEKGKGRFSMPGGDAGKGRFPGQGGDSKKGGGRDNGKNGKNGKTGRA